MQAQNTTGISTNQSFPHNIMRLNNLPQNPNMRPRKQPRRPRITPPKPIIINILPFRDLCAPRKHQFILNAVLGVPAPQRLCDDAHATVRWEAAGAGLNGCGWGWERWFGGVGVCPWCPCARGFFAAFGAFFPAPVTGPDFGGWCGGTSSGSSGGRCMCRRD